MKFEKYFPLPWKSDECIYAWSANNQTPFMIDSDDYPYYEDYLSILNNAVKIINGEMEPIYNTAVYNPEEQVVLLDDKYELIVRGWGYLSGSCKLDYEKAAEIQDEMGEWIANKLTKK